MKPHIRLNVRTEQNKKAQLRQLYCFLSSIASQPLHPLNESAQQLLLDIPKGWQVKA